MPRTIHFFVVLIFCSSLPTLTSYGSVSAIVFRGYERSSAPRPRRGVRNGGPLAARVRRQAPPKLLRRSESRFRRLEGEPSGDIAPRGLRRSTPKQRRAFDLPDRSVLGRRRTPRSGTWSRARGYGSETGHRNGDIPRDLRHVSVTFGRWVAGMMWMDDRCEMMCG